ncbi:LysM peptidoglycan-binding domain-containing protein [Pontibacter sp. SGAir0037]|uniref:LysM peptidoglycan-binding domain-containing protein n=1 Tax=Pontibacter sp. SGAir0037 TaxID=2571030 RepID=UPI0010CD3C61|nr:LysM peptidoglycan-binding domain-containing protein [Pontibacter sp. SGAir0037]QCR24546.1 lytic transglycosylase [Pontibacter sp. SGAir0037]
MRKSLPLLLLLLLPLMAWAQSAVVVPKNIYVADVHLKISDGAQQEIQKKVDALHRHPTYFNIKVNLADAYFPIIERTFREEGVPDDFKFLALQESGLIGDAVSTSNAVGYWQFKKEAAQDFSLRIDHIIDERKHIIEASRGAAKYFKRSNNYYDNWFNTILSYLLGYSGAKTATSPSDIGSKKMEVTEKTHPYLLTFLAHKVAYENFVGKRPIVSLREMRATPGQSLTDIALATQTDYAELEKYNKWLLGSSIPSDKDYYVMVPIQTGAEGGPLLASTTTSTPIAKQTTQPAASIIKKNGLNALVAREGDTKDKLALQAGISTRKFLNYNDMHSFDNIEKGSAYYIEQKRTKADKEYHVVQPGETMQMISQHYGMRLTYLLFKNRMDRAEVPVPGRVLWLQKRRPAKTPVEIRDLKQQPLSVPNTAIAVKEAPSPKVSASSTEAEPAPKENIFTRFINSLKKKPADTTEETVVVAAEETEDETEDEAALEEEFEETTYSIEEGEAVKRSTKAAVYPGKKTTTAPASPQSKPDSGTVAPVTTTVTNTTPVQESVFSSQPAPVQEKAPTPVTKATTHVVQQGETLYGISRMYAVSVNDISTWNNLGDEPIKIGQELLIAQPQMAPAERHEPFAPTATGSPYHTVETGETLYQITRKYGITMENLLDWNNMTDTNIKVGQQLRVVAPQGYTAPAAAPKPAASETSQGNYHVVQSGESMYQISRKYGVTIKDIMEWNKKSDFNVAVGEKLVVRKP